MAAAGSSPDASLQVQHPGLSRASIASYGFVLNDFGRRLHVANRRFKWQLPP
jgi:hypothetical protein